MDETRVNQLIDIFNELADLSGGLERTAIFPNLEVIDNSPSDLSSQYIIIQDQEGFYIPALKVPGVTYSNGDLVNVLFIKGTEPIAFQQGSGSGGGSGGGGWPFAAVFTVSTTDTDADYSSIQAAIDDTGNVPNGSAILLDNEVFAEDITVGRLLHFRGWGPKTTLIIGTGASLTNTVTVTASGVSFTNIEIYNSSTGSGTAAALKTSVNVNLYNCYLLKANLPTTAVALWVIGSGGGINLYDCELSSSHYGVAADTAASTVNVYGGTISGSTASIRLNHASATMNLYQRPVITDAITITAGTLRGDYSNATGNHIYVDGTTIGSTSSNVTYTNGIIIPSGSYIYGTPAGLGRPNGIHNAAFTVAQRPTTVAGAASGTYIVDRFLWGYVGTGVVTLTRESGAAPTVVQAGILYPYSLRADVTTADTSIASTDLYIFRHTMEGFDWLDYAQRDFTIGFWTAHTKTGIYCISFGNSGGDRTYVAEYTQAASDTWQFNTITVPASPSAGTWNYTTGAGLVISWSAAAGSNFQTTAGAWQTGNFLATSNQVNGMDSSSNNFNLGPMVIAPGPVAVSPRIPDREQEVNRCLRYAYVLDASTNAANVGWGARFSITGISVQVPLPVRMRTAPTLTHNATGYTPSAPGTTTIGLVNVGANAFFTVSGSLTWTLAQINQTFAGMQFTAGTSWNGTNNDAATLRLGPSVVAVLSADL